MLVAGKKFAQEKVTEVLQELGEDKCRKPKVYDY
jgi:hypothetical protein